MVQKRKIQYYLKKHVHLHANNCAKRRSFPANIINKRLQACSNVVEGNILSIRIDAGNMLSHDIITALKQGDDGPS